MTPELQLFLCGFFGSSVVELLAVLKFYQKPGRLPVRYRRFGFIFIRSLLACAGGIFAVLYHPQNLILAVHIGAATPLLVATFAETLPDEPKQ